MTASQTADTIRRHLGMLALAMVGAHQLGFSLDSLQFRIKGCRKGNLVVIRIAADDTYTVELHNSRTWSIVGRQEGVYIEQLHDVLEALTGLAWRM